MTTTTIVGLKWLKQKVEMSEDTWWHGVECWCIRPPCFQKVSHKVSALKLELVPRHFGRCIVKCLVGGFNPSLVKLGHFPINNIWNHHHHHLDFISIPPTAKSCTEMTPSQEGRSIILQEKVTLLQYHSCSFFSTVHGLCRRVSWHLSSISKEIKPSSRVVIVCWVCLGDSSGQTQAP